MKERQQNNRKGICNTPLPEHALAASQKYIINSQVWYSSSYETTPPCIIWVMGIFKSSLIIKR